MRCFSSFISLVKKKSLPGISTKWSQWQCISFGSQGKLMSWWEEREKGLLHGTELVGFGILLMPSWTPPKLIPFCSLSCLQTLIPPRHCDLYCLKEVQLALKPFPGSPTTQAWFTASMKERRDQQTFTESMPSFTSLSHPGGQACLRNTAGARGCCLTSNLLDCLGLSKDPTEV